MSIKLITMSSNKNKWAAVLFGVVLFSVAACSKDDDPKPDPDPGGDVTVENVTYTNFVASLFQSRCSSCHTGNGQGTAKWVFDGYSSVNANLATIDDVVVVRKVMPQGGSLSSTQLTLLKAWVDKGAPEE